MANMFRREKTPENTTPIEPQLLGRQLMRSFYISFALSQGLIRPQDDLLSLSSAYYQSIYGADVTACASQTIDGDFIKNLNLPKSHKTIGLDSYEAQEFSNRWKDYKQQLNKEHKPYNPETNHYKSRLLTVMADIAVRDLTYLEPKTEDSDRSQLGRGRANKKDPYKSYFREHVLVGVSTGDPNSFDPIFADAAGLFQPNTKLGFFNKVKVRKLENNTLPRLASSWENSHPDQKFADPEQITNRASLRLARLASDLTK